MHDYFRPTSFERQFFGTFKHDSRTRVCGTDLAKRICNNQTAKDWAWEGRTNGFKRYNFRMFSRQIARSSARAEFQQCSSTSKWLTKTVRPNNFKREQILVGGESTAAPRSPRPRLMDHGHHPSRRYREGRAGWCAFNFGPEATLMRTRCTSPMSVRPACFSQTSCFPAPEFGSPLGKESVTHFCNRAMWGIFYTTASGADRK